MSAVEDGYRVLDNVVLDADAIIGKSRDWVDSLDRSFLGSFAVDTELLAVMHAVYTVKAADWKRGSTDTNPAVNHEIVTRMNDRVAEATRKSHSDGVQDRGAVARAATAELFFWWSQASVNGAYMKMISPYPDGRKELLLSLAGNPARLPFYEVGLRDERFIDTCIAEGIDAAMAGEVAR